MRSPSRFCLLFEGVTYARGRWITSLQLLFAFTNKCRIEPSFRPRRRKRHAIRLLHAERQPLSRQSAQRRGFHQGHLRRGAVRREGRAELGLDRRAPFQPPGRQRLAAGDPGAARRRHDQAPPGARRDAAAGASSAACRRGVGDARSAVGRPRRFRRRPRLRPQGIRALPGPFDDSAELFAEGLEIVWRAWTETGKWSHKGKFYEFKDVEIRPRPAQKPLRPYVACFSRPSMELAAQATTGT